MAEMTPENPKSLPPSPDAPQPDGPPTFDIDALGDESILTNYERMRSALTEVYDTASGPWLASLTPETQDTIRAATGRFVR